MFQQEDLIPIMGKLGKFARRLTQNASDADDLVQSTMLRALEKKDYFEEGTDLFSWTSKIMFNLFASGYRHKKKYGTQYDPAHYIDHKAVAPTQEATVDLATVREYMKRLSKDHRDTLIQVCALGLSYEETSEALQIPVGTVRSRLFRARKQLQELMEPRAIGEISLAAAKYAAAQKSLESISSPAEREFTREDAPLRPFSA